MKEQQSMKQKKNIKIKTQKGKLTKIKKQTKNIVKHKIFMLVLMTKIIFTCMNWFQCLWKEVSKKKKNIIKDVFYAD